MAYATLLSLTQTLEQILCPAAGDADHVPVLHPTDQQIMASLHKKLSFLLTFLEDTPRKYIEIIRSLEGRIRDAAYETEGIIESHLSNLICSESTTNPIHEGIQKTLEEIDSILEEAVKMKDRIRIVDLPLSQPLPTASSKLGSVGRTDMVGFQENLMEIKDLLVRGTSRRQIVSIVGMGGIGKTTLAKTIYDYSLMVQNFDTRAWTTISHNYDVQQILSSLLDSMKISHKSDLKDKEKLAERLYKSLKGRRYLIVMDDLWDTNAWEEVKRLLPDDGNGSRIILTTRISEVAVSIDSSSPIHRPSLLGPIDSWELLRHKVFGKEGCPPQLEEVGKEIAENCKGLPIALVVIGGLLYKAERMLDYWIYVKENVTSLVNNTDDQFMEILALSYKELPHHLRACFLYMGVFPEDFQISIPRLIQLWVAEGFIKPDRSKSLEDVAEKYLEDLVDRNMIQIRKKKYINETEKCGIHDLMRDLCIRIAEQEKFLEAVNSQIEIPPDRRYNFGHLISHLDSHDHLAGSYGSHVRSLLCFDTTSQNTRQISRVFSPGQLRVIHAQDMRFDELPVNIAELVNLRYLAFIYRGNKLPSSIFKLLNLQVLYVNSTDTFILPVKIWKMKQLRHIMTFRCFLPYPSDAQNEENTVLLENLQTLTGVRNFRFTKEVLQMMPNLKTLHIRFSHDSFAESIDLSSYCIDNFVHLQQLEDFHCYFEGYSYLEGRCPSLDNLALPPSLRRLHLNGYRLSLKNMATIGSLRNLESLKLRRIIFDGQSWEPSEGEFLELKDLILHDTDLEYLTADETNFPKLECLKITNCLKLVEIPSRIGNIPTLELIEMSGCSQSAVSSGKAIQEEQKDLENYSLQVVIGNDMRIQLLSNLIALRFLKFPGEASKN